MWIKWKEGSSSSSSPLVLAVGRPVLLLEVLLQEGLSITQKDAFGRGMWGKGKIGEFAFLVFWDYYFSFSFFLTQIGTDGRKWSSLFLSHINLTQCLWVQMWASVSYSPFSPPLSQSKHLQGTTSSLFFRGWHPYKICKGRTMSSENFCLWV